MDKCEMDETRSTKSGSLKFIINDKLYKKTMWLHASAAVQNGDFSLF